MNETIFGVLYAVGAAFCFALWNIYMERGMQNGAPPEAPLLTLGVAEVGVTLPILVGQGIWLALPPVNLTGILYFMGAGLLSAGVAPLHSAQATLRVGATQTTALRLLDPFFAFAIGMAFLGERISLPATGGIVLIAAGLWVLHRSRGSTPAPAQKHGSRHSAGILFAVGASVWFTVASIWRKLGLLIIPSPLITTAVEGAAGILVFLAIWAGSRRSGRRLSLRQTLSGPGASDMWLSGISAAFGAYLLNLALQRLSVPIAVALRNTSPWFALLLVPLLLGRQHSPSRWVWASTVLLTCGMVLILAR